MDMGQVVALGKLYGCQERRCPQYKILEITLVQRSTGCSRHKILKRLQPTRDYSRQILKRFQLTASRDAQQSPAAHLPQYSLGSCRMLVSLVRNLRVFSFSTVKSSLLDTRPTHSAQSMNNSMKSSSWPRCWMGSLKQYCSQRSKSIFGSAHLSVSSKQSLS